MKIRSFLAFDIAEEMKKDLKALIDFLSPKAKGVKWVDPNLMHCTIKFFGDVEETILMGELSEIIKAEVAKTTAFRLKGVGIGAFPNWRYPRVIWAGLTGETEPIIGLHQRLEEVFEKFHIGRDQRALRLHLTLGRVKEAMKDKHDFISCVEKLSAKDFGNLEIKELMLYKSQLTPSGPIYTQLNSFPLKRNEEET